MRRTIKKQLPNNFSISHLRWLPPFSAAQQMAFKGAERIGVYDLETTGLDASFSAIFECAMRFADPKTLVPTGEAHMWKVALPEDIVPHPKAILVNHSQPKTWYQGQSAYSFAKEAHAQFNQPGTHMLGYNSIKFDNIMMRKAVFHRHLLPPYTHQYQAGCGHADVYAACLPFWAFGVADNIHWPVRGNKTSFKLADIKDDNQLVTGQSHTAMVDVNATLALAQRLREASPEFWTHIMAHFNSDYDRNLMEKCPTKVWIGGKDYPLGILMKRGFKQSDNHMTRVIFLGWHKTYTNQALLLNLRTGAITKKKTGGQELFFPSSLQDQRDLISAESEAEIQETLEKYHNHPERLAQLITREENNIYDDLDSDAYGALYQVGFATKELEATMQRFHQAEGAEKMEVANEFKAKNPVYYELAVRLIGNHFPEHLDKAALQCFNRHLKSLRKSSTAGINHRGEKNYTLEDAQKDIKKLAPTLKNKRDKVMLADYKDWHASRVRFLNSANPTRAIMKDQQKKQAKQTPSAPTREVIRDDFDCIDWRTARDSLFNSANPTRATMEDQPNKQAKQTSSAPTRNVS